MKLGNLHEADFARREIQNSRFFSYKPGAAVEADEPEGAPVEPIEPQAPPEAPGETPEGEPSDLGVTDLDDLGADAGADIGMGGGMPGPAPMQPEPMPGMQPEPMGEMPIQPVEQPQMYGDWQMVDSFDQRDKTLEHPSGIRLRIRNLSVHPDRYLAQLYKGKKMIHSGKKDVPDGEDPIQYIIDIAERSLNVEQPEADTEQPEDDEQPDVEQLGDEQPIDLGQSLNIEQPEMNL